MKELNKSEACYFLDGPYNLYGEASSRLFGLHEMRIVLILNRIVS